MGEEFEIAEGKHVFHVKGGRFSLLRVERIVKQGKSPRYEMKDTWSGKSLEFRIADQHEWFHKSVFLDATEAGEELERQLQAELAMMTNKILQSKEQLANHLFELWLAFEELTSYRPNETPAKRLMERKTELFVKRFEELFGVKLTVPERLRQSD